MFRKRPPILMFGGPKGVQGGSKAAPKAKQIAPPRRAASRQERIKSFPVVFREKDEGAVKSRFPAAEWLEKAGSQGAEGEKPRTQAGRVAESHPVP